MIRNGYPYRMSRGWSERISFRATMLLVCLVGFSWTTSRAEARKAYCILGSGENVSIAEDAQELGALLESHHGFENRRGEVISARSLVRPAVATEQCLYLWQGDVRGDASDLEIEIGGDFLLSFDAFLKQLSGASRQVGHVTVLIDSTSGFDQKLNQAFAEKLDGAGVSIDVIVRYRDATSSTKVSSLAAVVARALRTTRLSDDDRDGTMTTAELFQFVQRQTSDPRFASHWSSPRASDEHPLISFVEEPDLEVVLDDIADEIAHLSQDHSIDRLVVVPILMRLENQYFGSWISNYMADRLRTTSRLGDAVRQVDTREQVVAMLKESDITPSNLVSAFRTNPSVFFGSPNTAVLVGVFNGFDVVNGKPETIRDLRLHLHAYAGGAHRKLAGFRYDKVKLSRTQSDFVATHRLSMSRIKGIGDRQYPPHPLKSSSFRPYIKLIENQTELEPEFEGRNDSRMRVQMTPGATYQIEVDNRGGEDCFLRILVDGRNTHPDVPAGSRLDRDAKKVPGAIVSLNAARSWFVRKDAWFTIRGFYLNVKAGQNQALVHQFRVTDKLDGDDFDNWDTGEITIAVCEPVEKDAVAMGAIPEYATEFGKLQQTEVRPYQGNLAPSDHPSKIISIDYGI